jgi:hypothetical protein
MIFESKIDLEEVYQPHPLHEEYKRDIHGKYVAGMRNLDFSSTANIKADI